MERRGNKASWQICRWRVEAELVTPIAPTKTLYDAKMEGAGLKRLDEKSLMKELLRSGWKRMLGASLNPEDVEKAARELIKEMELRKLYVFHRDSEGTISLDSYWVKGSVKRVLSQYAEMMRVKRDHKAAKMYDRLVGFVRNFLSVEPKYIPLRRGGQPIKEVSRLIQVYVTTEHGTTNKFYELVDPPAVFECVITIPSIDGIVDYIEDAVKAVFSGVVGIGGLRSSGFGRLKQISLKREIIDMDVQVE